MKAADNELKEIRPLLPYNYSVIISNRLEERGVYETPETVRRIFAQRITNPDRVLPVLEEATRLCQRIQHTKRKVKKAVTKN